MRCVVFVLITGCATSPSPVTIDSAVEGVWDPSRGVVVIDASYADVGSDYVADHHFDSDQTILVGIDGQTVELAPTGQLVPQFEGVVSIAQPDGDLAILEVTHDDAFRSTFTLPDGFALDTFPTTVSLEAQVPLVTWTPMRKDAMRFSLKSDDCPDLSTVPEQIEMLDAGSLKLPVDYVFGTCHVTLVIDRYRDGAPAATGGSSTGIQRRTISLTVTP